jgi:hypothetical protein
MRSVWISGDFGGKGRVVAGGLGIRRVTVQ